MQSTLDPEAAYGKTGKHTTQDWSDPLDSFANVKITKDSIHGVIHSLYFVFKNN